MEEKIKDVLDAYTFQTTRVCRGKVHLSVTRTRNENYQGVSRSPQRLEFEQLVKYTIHDRGITWISCCRIKRAVSE